MSWDAALEDDRGHCEGSWNYTHNCNGMANAVLDRRELHDAALRMWAERSDIIERIEAEPLAWGSWWYVLDGMSGPDGAALLDRIIKGLEAEPERFRAMNPENGWGDYDSFLKVLAGMRDSVPEWPTKWTVHG